MDIVGLPSISMYVKESRLALGLDQVRFASLIGIGLKTLRKIEQGDLSVTYTKLVYVLNCLGMALQPQPLLTAPKNLHKKMLNKKNILLILTNIFPIFKIKYGVKSMALFGSYARSCAGCGQLICHF
jgi:transcriptional regulator with XRE-family HTH domain